MPNLSNRGVQMPESPIRKLVPYAEKAEADGKNVIKLNIGQPDIETPTEMLDALRNMEMTVLAYSHSAGNEVYRRKLAGYYKTMGIHLDYTDLLVTTGGSEALIFGLFSCLDPGDEIIVPEPFYANYNGFSTAGNINVKPITSSIETGFALPPISEFENLITPNTKAILICNPNNPTGYLYTREELEALKDIVLKHDLYLFVDEVYRDFCYDGREHVSILTMDGLDQHAVVIDSVSKKYSACGARVGALISKNKEVISTALKFAQARLSPPTLAQIAAEAGLEVGPEYINNVVEEYDRRRELVVQRLSSMPGVVCPRPGGAFYCFLQLPVDNSEKFCQWLLEDFDYQNQTLMMAPGHGFYATKGLGEQEVRLAYVLETGKLEMALTILEKALQTYPGRLESATATGMIDSVDA